MKRLSIYTQGVTGREPRPSTQGRVTVYSDNSRVVSIDNFQGYGDNYKQRDEPIITIYDARNPPNEIIMFSGTQSQLVDILSKVQ